MRDKGHHRPQLGVETLEQRCLLAGNVTATVVFGELRVVGDSAANDIVIYQTDHGTIKVFGRTDNTVTTVNGQPFFETSALVRSVSVNLGGGDDGLNMALVLCGNLTVNMGGGNDFVALADSGSMPEVSDADPNLMTPEVHGNFTINTGSGQDVVFINPTVVSGNLVIDAGSDNDIVSIFGISVGGRTDIQMGSGGDTLGIAFSTFAGRVNLVGGLGPDTLDLFDNTFAVPPTISGFES